MSKRLQARLPDFRNLGVILRIVLLVEGGACLVQLSNEQGFREALDAFVDTGLLREPVLLLSMLALFAVSPLLERQPYRRGAFLILAGVFALGASVHIAYVHWLPVEMAGGAVRTGLLAAVTAGVALAYFNCRYRALSPALSEARLMALQSRIRPHFLFNSLNTVLGLMRADARRAETVLENLAELYRALLSEAGTLVPLAKELELAHAYSEIEMTRLGGRLRLNWQCQESALDALVPPLILQPLLENAVYHGVEPSESGGQVDVAIFLKGDRLNLVVRNPCGAPSQRQGGNRMALANIRERLDLHFDAEAEMSTYRAGDEFVVQIRMPYKHA